MSEQPAPKPLAQRQGLKDGMTVAFWPDRDALPQAVQEFGEHHSVTPSLGEADFIAAHVPDCASAIAFCDSNLVAIAEVTGIWLIYPKGNRADINRDSLWALLLEYGWRSVSNISVDDTHSSIRIRPLKPGETGLHK